MSCRGPRSDWVNSICRGTTLIRSVHDCVVLSGPPSRSFSRCCRYANQTNVCRLSERWRDSKQETRMHCSDRCNESANPLDSLERVLPLFLLGPVALLQKYRRAQTERLAAPQCGKACLSARVKSFSRLCLRTPEAEPPQEVRVAPVRQALPHWDAASRQPNFRRRFNSCFHPLLQQSPRPPLRGSLSQRIIYPRLANPRLGLNSDHCYAAR